MDEIEIRVPDGPSAVYGASLPRNPRGTLATVLGQPAMPHERTVSTRRILRGWRSAVWAFTCEARQRVGTLFGKDMRSQPQGDRSNSGSRQSTYFHSPDRYSAYVLFSFGVKFAARLHRSGVAVFAGGMTEVLSRPSRRMHPAAWRHRYCGRPGSGPDLRRRTYQWNQSGVAGISS